MLKFLRHRLKKRKSSKYLSWLKKTYPNMDPDHLIGSMGALKLNDYLVVMRSREEHFRRHNNGFEDFNSDLATALENIFDYVEFLEQKVK